MSIADEAHAEAEEGNEIDRDAENEASRFLRERKASRKPEAAPSDREALTAIRDAYDRTMDMRPACDDDFYAAVQEALNRVCDSDGNFIEAPPSDNLTDEDAATMNANTLRTLSARREAAPSDTDLRERAYAAVWAGKDFFQDRGTCQTAVDNGFIWRNVERALDAIIPLPATSQPVQVEVTAGEVEPDVDA